MAEFTVDHARPDRAIWLLYSLEGTGVTYIRALNVIVDLHKPLIGAGPRLPDANGHVQWRVRMPVISHGMYVRLQAAQYETLTNLVETGIVRP